MTKAYQRMSQGEGKSGLGHGSSQLWLLGKAFQKRKVSSPAPVTMV